MVGLNTSSTARSEEFGQSLVLEAPNHAQKRNLCRIRCQHRSWGAYNGLLKRPDRITLRLLTPARRAAPVVTSLPESTTWHTWPTEFAC
jgi:hypothetical protein